MRELPDDDIDLVREHYQHFAEVEAAPVSPLYERWAAGAARDEELVGRLMRLPPAKRQPNLLFAAARVHGVPLKAWSIARGVLMDRWDAISETMLVRRTQTNEVGRICALNLAFERIAAEVGKPLALVEVGASAGLCLYPDVWTLRYTFEDIEQEDAVIGPRGSLRSGVELACSLRGLRAPDSLPRVVSRSGIDLNPLDLGRPENRRWLEALVWPGMEYRLERIAAGAELVAADPPQMFTGDLNEMLPRALQEVPAGAVPVVFHSAVMAYLSREDRARFVHQVRASGARWVSNEGPGVLPEIAAKLPAGNRDESGFILSLDGEPLARSGPHGQYVHALR